MSVTATASLDDTVLAAFRKIEMPLNRMFPPGRAASPLIIAILVRADEIMYLLRQMQAATATEAEREALGDLRPVLDRFIVGRLLFVSLDDGVKRLVNFTDQPEIRGELRSHRGLGKKFRGAVAQLAENAAKLNDIRDQIGAHLDITTLTSYLTGLPDDVTGELWLAEAEHMTTQYDAAHLVAIGACVQAAAGKHRPIDHATAVAEFDRLIGVAQDAQAKFVALARVALRLFEATAGGES